MSKYSKVNLKGPGLHILSVYFEFHLIARIPFNVTL